jgi:hypothetical protein
MTDGPSPASSRSIVVLDEKGSVKYVEQCPRYPGARPRESAAVNR